MQRQGPSGGERGGAWCLAVETLCLAVETRCARQCKPVGTVYDAMHMVCTVMECVCKVCQPVEARSI
eukprot:11775-Heterococcus_DN1.PRE.2